MARRGGAHSPGIQYHPEERREIMKRIAMAGFIGLVCLIGCADNTSGPRATSGASVPVAVMGVAGLDGGSGPLMKSNGTEGMIDSLRVTSSIIILKDIAFHSHIDTAQVRDSSEVEREDMDEEREQHDGEHHDGKGYGNTEHFRGPFVVELLNNTPTQIALDTIPPGTYDGIKFVLHKLHRHDVVTNPLFPDSLVGYSVVVSGNVFYAGQGGTPFVFKTDINEEFKVRGDFVVEEGSNLVPYALDFQMNTWFDGRTRILDPNSYMDRRIIRWNIKHAFKDLMKGGRDWNHDGHPDR
jgi:hypothetical protein